MSTGKRPTGITILAAVQIIAGLIYLLGGAAMTFSGSYMGGVYGDFGGIIGAVLVGLGLLEFVIAWGYLTRKPWSRIVGLVFAGIGIFEGVSSLPTGLITIAIDAVVIYYLTRPHIVDWFAGKSLEPAQPPPPAPPTI